MMLRLIIAGWGVLSITVVHAQENAWRSYSNPRFGVSFDYPAMFSRRDPPPDNGDGQAFRTADGATLRVYGFYNIDHASTDKLLTEQTSSGVRITYRMSEKDRFAYSGTRGATEIYLRCSRSTDDVIGCVELIYHTGDDRSWSAIVTKISRSLRVK